MVFRTATGGQSAQRLHYCTVCTAKRMEANLSCQGLDHARINLNGQLPPEVELRAEGLSLEGGLQRRDWQL